MNDQRRAVAPISFATRRWLLSAAIAGCLHAVPASAQLGAYDEWARIASVVGPYASATVGYDSNTYRLDDDVPEIGGARDDAIGKLALGFDSKLERAQQAFVLGAEINHSWFSEHDELDFTGGNARAIWNWSTGGIASGDLGYRYRRTLRDFANQFRPERFKDIRSEHQVLASADFDVPGNLIIGTRARWSDISFSETDILDLKRSVYGADLRYVSSSGNIVALDGEWIKADFDNNPVGDYDEYTIGPRVEWQLAGRTRVDASVGYTQRDFSNAAREDVDEVVGDVTLQFGEPKDSGVEARVYRELTNFGDESAEYATVNGISVEPRWRIREGVALRASAAYERRDFEVPPQTEDRSDDVVAAGLHVDWDVRRNVTLSIGADTERRDSTRALQDYDSTRFQVQFVARL
jgi:hypothetical protein